MKAEIGLFDAIYHCRAMRKLDTREVPEDLLVKLIDAANQAPSGSNVQAARWIIVRDPVIRRQLADLNRKGVEAYIGPQLKPAGEVSQRPAGKQQRMLDAVVWQMEHMHEIPALVIACMEFGQPVTPAMLAGGSGSIWPGIQNLLLAARGLGLGAAPTTLSLRTPASIAKILKLPATMAAYCLIPVGYPLGKFGPVTRKPVKEIMRFDSWES